jgi:hypothetical protein
VRRTNRRRIDDVQIQEVNLGFFSNKSEKSDSKVEVEGPRAKLEKRIRELVVKRASQNVVAMQATRVANSTTGTAADLSDTKILRNEASLVRKLLEETEADLTAARAELRIHDLIQQKPAKLAHLEKVKILVHRRNGVAETVQECLLRFSDSIHQLDDITDELHMLCRAPDDRGVAATASSWHPLNQSSRLRMVLAMALRGTHYSRLTRQPLLTPSDDKIDFAEVEKRVGQTLVGQLEKEIAEIDKLGLGSQEEEVA